MVEVLKTDDPIRLHFFKTLLEEAEIDALVIDGGVYVQLPRRLMVPDDDADMARRLIAEAERSL